MNIIQKKNKSKKTSTPKPHAHSSGKPSTPYENSTPALSRGLRTGPHSGESLAYGKPRSSAYGRGDDGSGAI